MIRFTSLMLILSTLMLANAPVRGESTGDEGKLAEPRAEPDANRVARYARSALPPAQALMSEGARSRRHAAAKPATHASKPQRGALMMSARASNFYIYDARASLLRDRDADGYHSEFRIRFDADVYGGDALVYARLYLRRAGESAWYLYHETDDFWIYGQSGDDDYYVTTTLDAGYPTAEYDVLIDLYESGYSGIVATLGPLESGALSYLPLEEVGLDVPVGMAGYSIGEVYADLIADDDGDGFYSRFRLSFDPHADYERRWIYAVVWVRARGGEWIQEFVSEDWLVETSGIEDAYVLDVDWLSGYPTSYYDVQIDLHDAASGLLIASAGSERPALAQLPLEDRSLDQATSVPAPGAGGIAKSREGGGGGLGAWSLLALLGLAGWRRRAAAR